MPLKSDSRRIKNRPVHTNRQKDLFKGTSDPKMVKDALYRGSSKHLHTKSNGRGRSLFDYINRTNRDKQKELKEEMKNAEDGGTEYWSTFRR